jgi:hypothetical protein
MAKDRHTLTVTVPTTQLLIRLGERISSNLLKLFLKHCQAGRARCMICCPSALTKLGKHQSLHSTEKVYQKAFQDFQKVIKKVLESALWRDFALLGSFPIAARMKP